MPPPPGDPPATRTDRELRELLDRERQRSAVSERRQRGWLLRQASEELTFASVLVQLSQRRASVALDLVGGRSVAGTLVEVGDDVAALRTTEGAAVLVATWAVTAVRTAADATATTGPGAPPAVDPPRRSLIELLADLAQAGGSQGTTVALWLCDGQRLAGRLALTGADVLAVWVDGRHRAHVPLDAVVCAQPG